MKHSFLITIDAADLFTAPADDPGAFSPNVQAELLETALRDTFRETDWPSAKIEFVESLKD